jgi:diguanylate cyclase (GGDEF)-like protein/PAS domain S-box-containing protein
VLEPSEELFRTLASHTPVGVFVTDASGGCVYVNERWAELAGVPTEAAAGYGWAEVVHPDDRERVAASWSDAVASGRDHAVELRFLRPDGEILWIDAFAAALRDEDGSVHGWVGTCLDLTARRQAENALRESGERFRVAFDNAPIGVALLTPDGRWFHVNPALCRILGYTAEELSELTFADITHPDDLDANLARSREQLTGGDWQPRIEKRYIHADGHVVWVALTNEVVHDPSGEPLYFVAHIEDITESRKIQLALREAEERFRRAFDDAPIGMGLVAPDGRWLRVNRTLTEITGYSEAELLERRFQDVTHPDDLDLDVTQATSLLADEIRSYRMEKRYVRPDGSSVWVMLSVSLVRDESGAPLYFVSQVEDISERKAAEQELKRLAEHDSLTGLLNRRRFGEELERELARLARHPGQHAGLLLLDVDRFKEVNDSLGHPAGDDVLCAIAQTLTRRLRGTDVVARLGGDEFAALVIDLHDPCDAGEIAREVAQAVRSQTILTVGGPTAVTVSIGVVPLDHTTCTREFDSLIAADNAMYSAKRAGRDRVSQAA